MKPSKIFFSGIGGSGMSAIAMFMSDKGYMVSGSDRAFDGNSKHPALQLFRSKAITIVPQDGTGINKTFNIVVFSTAVEHNHIEYKRAESLGLSIMTRPEYLAEIIKGYKTIAVSGTSGKSTTTGLLAFMMHQLGLNANFIGGGRVKDFKTSTNPGNAKVGKSDLMIIEACESDGSIVNYYPENSIILNLDLDHHSIEETSVMFKVLNEHTSGLTVINTDDGNIKNINIKNAVTFSIDDTSDYRAEHIIYEPFSSNFTVRETRFNLPLAGRHNIYNALSAIAMLSEMGVRLSEIASVMLRFSGIERRFDIHLNNVNHLVIDDYAHNPHKITSLMQTVRGIKDNICYIFQPHGYAPTRMMKNEYISAFASNMKESDHLILLPIFYAGGTVSKDISSQDIADGVSAKGKSAEYVDDRKVILQRLDEWGNYIIFGARDETLSAFAKEIAVLLRK